RRATSEADPPITPRLRPPPPPASSPRHPDLFPPRRRPRRRGARRRTRARAPTSPRAPTTAGRGPREEDDVTAPANVPPRGSHTGPDEVLRRLDLAIGHKLDGLLHGEYQGLVPGHGSELGETRGYTPGDDVRRIDWNVTARMQTPHVRDTIADRELETWALVDLGPSMDFGTAYCEKRDMAVSAAAAVGFLTNRTGNRFGVAIARPDGTEVVP